jgi:catechol 2,3-dioxygenase-like lactoylglutathione lyase family enzyme
VEVIMSGTQMSKEPVSQDQASQIAKPATSDLKLEVVILPVSDVDRTKRFYEGLGWRIDADFANGDWRAMQMTPPGSPCAPGRDPQGRSYSSWASFSDPDGNTWMLQEITTRLPGRGYGVDIPTLTSLLKEAEQNHGNYEATAPKHHWSDWYGAYLVARQSGSTPEVAAESATRHMATVLK